MTRLSCQFLCLYLWKTSTSAYKKLCQNVKKYRRRMRIQIVLSGWSSVWQCWRIRSLLLSWSGSDQRNYTVPLPLNLFIIRWKNILHIKMPYLTKRKSFSHEFFLTEMNVEYCEFNRSGSDPVSNRWWNPQPRPKANYLTDSTLWDVKICYWTVLKALKIKWNKCMNSVVIFSVVFSLETVYCRLLFKLKKHFTHLYFWWTNFTVYFVIND